MIERLKEGSSIIVAGHRGYKSAFPENTLLGFQQAIDLGVEMLEFDLRLSKDKVLMVIHDDSLDRTTNGSGKVSDYSKKELKEFDACNGFSDFGKQEIPTFTELCELLKPCQDILLNVEIKPSVDAKEVADQAIAMLKEYGYLSRCVFTSFDADIVAYIHDVYGLKTQGFPGEIMFHFAPGDNGTYSKMWAVGVSMKLLTPERVQFFKEQGILVWCYCPDDEQQVLYALECGATLLTCNNPVPALSIREKVGK
ncbi:glycerophosphodiester phosphodiesterase [Neobacillus sp. MM2021_6]|uniref:glycerophosphodiester phosphodiesterase family protein n=1 Tax=Bacillaceae TaxID=186817 RepID=UPI0014082ACA|nr:MULTISPECIES: glycerophosphodiester phosphodiesterase family protein [Bacillaceae]MBO0958804.1 glycerophosphodiester phosphodiesterase [Neobacillus sp. MM2021_6]NHC20029.1 glycerophosphodiester phosphodiesterase [Bacillus sp. MM2020_4]